ncbi:hypothetical protein [Azospirillum doebereinerae]|nr:hypothetical protein [Azospirillum doebereinerae]
MKRLNDLRGSIGGGWADLLDQDRAGPPDTPRRRKTAPAPEKES